jgi:hypothetical protein
MTPRSVKPAKLDLRSSRSAASRVWSVSSSGELSAAMNSSALTRSSMK